MAKYSLLTFPGFRAEGQDTLRTGARRRTKIVRFCCISISITQGQDRESCRSVPDDELGCDTAISQSVSQGQEEERKNSEALFYPCKEEKSTRKERWI